MSKRICLGFHWGVSTKEARASAKAEARAAVERLGGKIVRAVGPRTDVLLTSPEDAQMKSSLKVSKARKQGTPIVSLDWLVACEKQNSFVDPSSFVLSATAPPLRPPLRPPLDSKGGNVTVTDTSVQTSPPPTPPSLEQASDGFNSTACCLSSEAYKTSSSDSSMGVGSKVIMGPPATPPKKKQPGRVAVPAANKAPSGSGEFTPRGIADAASGVQGGMLLPGWECLLTFPSTPTPSTLIETGNICQRYAMQIIVKSVDGGGEAGAGAQESFVFVRWGFDGQKSSMCRLNGPFDTLEEAKIFFSNRFHDKTGVQWQDVAVSGQAVDKKGRHKVAFAPCLRDPSDVHAAPLLRSQHRDHTTTTRDLMALMTSQAAIHEILEKTGLDPVLSSALGINKAQYRSSDASGLSRNASELSRNASELSRNASELSWNTSELSRNSSEVSRNTSEVSGYQADDSGSSGQQPAPNSVREMLGETSASSHGNNWTSNHTNRTRPGSGRGDTSSGSNLNSASSQADENALSKAKNILGELQALIRSKDKGEERTDFDADVAALSEAFYRIAAQKSGEMPPIDSKEIWEIKAMQVSVLTDVVSIFGLTYTVSPSGSAILAFADGTKTSLVPLATKSKDYHAVQNMVRSMAAKGAIQHQEVTGMWLVEQLPSTSTFIHSSEGVREAQDVAGMVKRCLMLYPEMPLGLVASVRFGTVSPFWPSTGDLNGRIFLFPGLQEAVENVSDPPTSMRQGDVIIMAVCEVLRTSLTRSKNGAMPPAPSPTTSLSEMPIIEATDITTLNGHVDDQTLPSFDWGRPELSQLQPILTEPLLELECGQFGLPEANASMPYNVTSLPSKATASAPQTVQNPDPTKPAVKEAYVVKYIVTIKTGKNAKHNKLQEGEIVEDAEVANRLGDSDAKAQLQQ